MPYVIQSQEITHLTSFMAPIEWIDVLVLSSNSCDFIDHNKGSSINHVVRFLGIFDPPSPLRGHCYKIRLM